MDPFLGYQQQSKEEAPRGVDFGEKLQEYRQKYQVSIRKEKKDHMIRRVRLQMQAQHEEEALNSQKTMPFDEKHILSFYENPNIPELVALMDCYLRNYSNQTVSVIEKRGLQAFMQICLENLRILDFSVLLRNLLCSRMDSESTLLMLHPLERCLEEIKFSKATRNDVEANKHIKQYLWIINCLFDILFKYEDSFGHFRILVKEMPFLTTLKRNDVLAITLCSTLSIKEIFVWNSDVLSFLMEWFFEESRDKIKDVLFQAIMIILDYAKPNELEPFTRAYYQVLHHVTLFVENHSFKREGIKGLTKLATKLKIKAVLMLMSDDKFIKELNIWMEMGPYHDRLEAFILARTIVETLPSGFTTYHEKIKSDFLKIAFDIMQETGSSMKLVVQAMKLMNSYLNVYPVDELFGAELQGMRRYEMRFVLDNLLQNRDNTIQRLAQELEGKLQIMSIQDQN